MRRKSSCLVFDYIIVRRPKYRMTEHRRTDRCGGIHFLPLILSCITARSAHAPEDDGVEPLFLGRVCLERFLRGEGWRGGLLARTPPLQGLLPCQRIFNYLLASSIATATATVIPNHGGLCCEILIWLNFY